MILLFAAVVIVYVGGILGQFIGNYDVWRQNGGQLGSGPAPPLLSLLI